MLTIGGLYQVVIVVHRLLRVVCSSHNCFPLGTFTRIVQLNLTRSFGMAGEIMILVVEKRVRNGGGCGSRKPLNLLKLANPASAAHWTSIVPSSLIYSDIVITYYNNIY